MSGTWDKYFGGNVALIFHGNMTKLPHSHSLGCFTSYAGTTLGTVKSGLQAGQVTLPRYSGKTSMGRFKQPGPDCIRYQRPLKHLLYTSTLTMQHAVYKQEHEEEWISPCCSWSSGYHATDATAQLHKKKSYIPVMSLLGLKHLHCHQPALVSIAHGNIIIHVAQLSRMMFLSKQAKYHVTLEVLICVPFRRTMGPQPATSCWAMVWRDQPATQTDGQATCVDCSFSTELLCVLTPAAKALVFPFP